MSVLVYAESPMGKFKKAAYEALSYGKKVAEALQTDCFALVLGNADNAADLGLFGAQKVIQIKNAALESFDAAVYAAAISEAVKSIGADTVVLSHSSTGKAIAGRIAVRLGAGLVSGVNSLPTSVQPFSVQKSVFSGKAIAEYSFETSIRVISLLGNAFPPQKTGAPAPVETMEVVLPASKVKVLETKRVEGTVPLPEAEIVVSAGRGMKDPSNWGMIEEMAKILGATTACSRPVADAHWRPHHEHVGQTGLAIRPNLYIAIGISGAIQHLAGVNNSKVIVVINKDPEAPFFKAADYGVVGDLFEIVPKLNEALKQFKASAH
ncbi:MAG: electron transfer flavoprotein subunit alpha/FixB family protein [Saprospiraceae bacterium]